MSVDYDWLNQRRLISLVSTKVDGGVTIQPVAGHHRLAAAKKLGWDEIPCFIIEGDNLTAEMWEISENLHRADLSKEQRDEYIRRYAELLRRQEIEKAKVVQSEPLSPPTGRGNKGVARKIADETGLSKSTVQRVLNQYLQFPNPVYARRPR